MNDDTSIMLYDSLLFIKDRLIPDLENFFRWLTQENESIDVLNSRLEEIKSLTIIMSEFESIVLNVDGSIIDNNSADINGESSELYALIKKYTVLSIRSAVLRKMTNISFFLKNILPINCKIYFIWFP